MKGRAPPCSPPRRGVGNLVVSRAAAQAGISVFNPDNKIRAIAPGMQPLPGLCWCLVPFKQQINVCEHADSPQLQIATLIA